MAEELLVDQSASKQERYQQLLPQLKVLVEGEPNLIANLANIVAALKQTFDFFWVGFYLVEQAELVLGPFQGPVACTRIKLGSGVCGKAWQEQEVIVVPDVEKFPGHIACNSASKSEIVVPVIIDSKVVMVLDVDSDQLDAFDTIDKQELARIGSLIAEII